MSNDVKVEGMERITERLEAMASAQNAAEALGRACALVERAAKQKAPKGNGDLRRSISSRVEDNQGIVFTPLEYAPYVEFGTGLFAENGEGRTWDLPWHYQDEEGVWHSSNGQEPHPFLRPALYENRKKIQQILKEGITK